MARTSISADMDSARIPSAARATTLPKLGQSDLRHTLEEARLDYVISTDSSGTDLLGTRGICINPGKRSDYPTARLVCTVLAKEMVLAGYSRVVVWTLDEILDQLEEDPRLSWDWNKQYGTTIILDFYMHETPTPMTGKQASKIQSMIMNGIDNGYPFVVLTDVPIARASGWWSPAFLSVLGGHNLSVEV